MYTFFYLFSLPVPSSYSGTSSDLAFGAITSSHSGVVSARMLATKAVRKVCVVPTRFAALAKYSPSSQRSKSLTSPRCRLAMSRASRVMNPWRIKGDRRCALRVNVFMLRHTQAPGSAGALTGVGSCSDIAGDFVNRAKSRAARSTYGACTGGF